VVAVMIVVVDEGRDRLFESPGQVVVLKENSVLQGLMPALDLALGLWVPGRATDVIHALVGKPVGQFAGDVAAAIVAEQPGRWMTVARSQPEAARASSSVAVTSDAFIVVQSRHATTKRL